MSGEPLASHKTARWKPSHWFDYNLVQRWFRSE
jgi:hypothetical protein